MNQLERDIALARRIKEIENLYNQLIGHVDVVRNLSDANKQQLARILNLPKGDRGEKGDQGPRGLTGKEGYTPVKGKDYTDGKTPVRGIDYFTRNDEETLLLKTLARIQQPKDGETPIVDEERIAALAAALIREKQLLGINDVKGVREEMSSYRHQMAMKQAGQHGGGDTVVAGTGITITPNSDGTKTIAATGGGGVTVETPVGTVDSINATFTVSAEPQWIVSDGITYFDGAGYSYAALTVTMDIPPSSFIRAII